MRIVFDENEFDGANGLQRNFLLFPSGLQESCHCSFIRVSTFDGLHFQSHYRKRMNRCTITFAATHKEFIGLELFFHFLY